MSSVRSVRVIGIIIPLLIAGIWYSHITTIDNRAPFLKLIAMSKKGEPLTYTGDLFTGPIGTMRIPMADAIIRSDPDYRSYHILMALRDVSPRRYYAIPVDVRAAILCGALSRAENLADWGLLAPELCYDEESARALLETGRVAVPLLRPLLEDRRCTECFSLICRKRYDVIYQYRRCDYAYRYICLLMGWDHVFDPDPKDRDKVIESIKERLRMP